MLINLRNALMAGKKSPTAKDYVQDAALYLFDGIENTAFGRRDATQNFWQDLITGEKIIPATITYPTSMAGQTPNVQWDNTGWNSILLECGTGISQNANLIQNNTFTVEFVFTNRATSYNATAIRTRVNDVNNGFQLNVPPGTGYANPIFFKPSDIQNNVASWHSVVFCSPGTNISIYSDGVYAKTASISSTQISNYLKNRRPLKIGAYNTERLGADQGQFNGIIHGIRAHSRILTADEIARNYSIDKARFNLP